MKHNSLNKQLKSIYPEFASELDVLHRQVFADLRDVPVGVSFVLMHFSLLLQTLRVTGLNN